MCVLIVSLFSNTVLAKKHDLDFFPVPIVATRPDEKETYGFMPVLIFSEHESKAIQAIVAAFAQYNTVIKTSGALLLQYWPHPTNNPDEQVQIYTQLADRYYREVSGGYFNPHWNQFYTDTQFAYIRTPFRRFYGYGANTEQRAESNYVLESLNASTTFGYYFFPKFRLNLTEQIYAAKLFDQAIFDVADTLTAFNGTSGVVDSTNLIHKISLNYDTRPQGANSKKGFLIEETYFLSHQSFASENTFQGYSVEGIFLQPFFQERTVTALRFFLQDMYGHDIPFYLRSTLGGENELRSFIPNRFTDSGKITFTWEQRIHFLKKAVFGIPFEVSLDPFFEVARVFNHLNHLGFQDYQPVGGLGIRLIVPPNLTARIDTAFGTEGHSVYTLLGYPF